MDVYDKTKRSEIMSKVRYKNGKSTELKLIKMFKDRHITGWRRTYKMIGIKKENEISKETNP